MFTTLRQSPKLISITFFLLVAIVLSNCAPAGEPVTGPAAPPAAAGAQVNFQLVPTSELTSTTESAYAYLLVKADALPASVFATLNQGDVFTTTLALVPRAIFTDQQIAIPDQALALIAGDELPHDGPASNYLMLDQAAISTLAEPLLLDAAGMVSTTQGIGYSFTPRLESIGSPAIHLTYSPVGSGEDPAPRCGCRMFWWCMCATSDLVPAGFELSQPFTLPHDLTIPAGYALPADFALPPGCEVNQSCELPSGYELPPGFVLPETYVLPHGMERPEGIPPAAEE